METLVGKEYPAEPCLINISMPVHPSARKNSVTKPEFHRNWSNNVNYGSANCVTFISPSSVTISFERSQRASELFLFSFSYSFAISFPRCFIVLVEIRSVCSPRLIEEEEGKRYNSRFEPVVIFEHEANLIYPRESTLLPVNLIPPRHQ